VLLRNLVDNAVRYSPHGTSVNVDVLSRSEGATISVTDEGPGVALDERARLGQRFYRVLGSGQTGSGLGLSIVRRIAEMHSARLRFEEGDNRKGLRVVVEFPRAADT
jgi:signal transduction histidine kinase